ncbi:hypothetical protein CPC08DRAFT_668418 [Agrocybe pediades]|nr:hypothetical protein CPC08DRAFT_668418 [Agrocybe pediades]
MTLQPTLEALVKEWLRLDPNPVTRDEIQALWTQQDHNELEKRLRTRIEFGTAGLRGRMEAGWSRMNDLIIAQTSQGLSDYVLGHVKEAKDRGLVIGYDHRHHSERWANLTADIFASKGIKVYLLKGFVHTPLVPFGVKTMNAACGVMITASHNPKQDNGYKVYWENAVQIIAPHDRGISHAIKLAIDRLDSSAAKCEASGELIIDRTQELQSAYFTYLKGLTPPAVPPIVAPPKFVNTSMHGVGDPFVKRAFEITGLSPYIPVKEQQMPDPDFPTVKFPNPEEKGALDLALETATREGADYVLAQDPDADRFTAAEKRSTGEWVLFTGDQLGALFASTVLQKYKASGQPMKKLAMVASTVSSKMLEAMAGKEGFKFVECLTGFKFIGNTALQLVDEGFEVPFGYEEAIGYMFGAHIRDKDGVAATIQFAKLVASLHEQGKTAYEHLQELYDEYGYFETRNGYFTCMDPEITQKIFTRLRSYGPPEKSKSTYPQTLGSLEVTRVTDLTTGYDSGNPPTYEPELPLSSGQMIQFRARDVQLGTNLVLTLRTSGTEPKIKYYLEGNGKDSQQVADVLSKAVADISMNWMQSEKYKLSMS